MLCEKCHKREAKVYCTEIINGEKKEQRLCEECAAEYASFKLESAGFKGFDITGLLAGILNGSSQEQQAVNAEPLEELSCPVCGLTFQEFLQKGKFGCAGCYRSFGKVLEKSFRQIQGNEKHTGKRPKGYVSPVEKAVKQLTEADRLTLKLQEAVEKEEFEEAARLRDQIRELKAREEVPHA